MFRVDVKSWLISNGYINDTKTITDKGKEIGLHEVVTEEHGNRRIVYDENAQQFIKDHIKDIEKLTGRSVFKEIEQSEDITL